MQYVLQKFCEVYGFIVKVEFEDTVKVMECQDLNLRKDQLMRQKGEEEQKKWWEVEG